MFVMFLWHIYVPVHSDGHVIYTYYMHLARIWGAKVCTSGIVHVSLLHIQKL